jgi:thiamine pyrophosphate-dependent acetolactate synthase large subunit-like protein
VPRWRCPDETIWVVVGDGGFQMTESEIATMAQEGLTNVKIAIVNNGYLGMVRPVAAAVRGKAVQRHATHRSLTSRNSQKRTACAA